MGANEIWRSSRFNRSWLDKSSTEETINRRNCCRASEQVIAFSYIAFDICIQGWGALMTRSRWITEMGLGVDVHGSDYTKAGKRAISDALRHSSLSFFQATDKSVDQMHVQVIIGAAQPDLIDTAELAREVPYGTVEVTVTSGGLDVLSEDGSDQITMVNAAILVSFID